MEEILAGYVRGTRFGIRADDDGLLAAGVPGLQVTWMDAKVGDWVVTPRIGKPVEVQALWLNALWVGSKFSQRWERGLARGRKAFAERFWNAEGGCLFDVVDVDHCPGVNDAAFRPNQIFAVGGLPVAILEGEQAQRIVEAVEARLLTPLGLRTLASGRWSLTGRGRAVVGTRLVADRYRAGRFGPRLGGLGTGAALAARGVVLRRCPAGVGGRTGR